MWPRLLHGTSLTAWCIQDVATSWQKLTEASFWRKFSCDQKHMSFTKICAALQAERMAMNRHLAEAARVRYGKDFGQSFTYRRGNKHLVTKSDSAIARRYCSLQDSE